MDFSPPLGLCAFLFCLFCCEALATSPFFTQRVGFEPQTFMDREAVAERCASGIHEVRKFPYLCSRNADAPIESALAEQDVRPGNFLLFLGLPYDRKKDTSRWDMSFFTQRVGFEPTVGY